jgi:hypothetical protein
VEREATAQDVWGGTVAVGLTSTLLADGILRHLFGDSARAGSTALVTAQASVAAGSTHQPPSLNAVLGSPEVLTLRDRVAGMSFHRACPPWTAHFGLVRDLPGADIRGELELGFWLATAVAVLRAWLCPAG